MIEPTIGRVLWYHPNPADGDPMPLVHELPYKADLICFFGPRDVMLYIVSHDGKTFSKRVRLAQDDDVVERGMAQWMPYQIGQSRKDESRSENMAEYATTEDLGRHALDLHESLSTHGYNLTQVDQRLSGRIDALEAHLTKPVSDADTGDHESSAG